jgi:pyruvate/2-oxoglutarate dehydrogenase complex dihydrolipoamide dehydrogenase (E3) component
MKYEVAVIGSGSAGKEAALLAVRQGRRVVVIEKETLGGTCFHRGCFAIRTLRACADADVKGFLKRRPFWLRPLLRPKKGVS